MPQAPINLHDPVNQAGNTQPHSPGQDPAALPLEALPSSGAGRGARPAVIAGTPPRQEDAGGCAPAELLVEQETLTASTKTGESLREVLWQFKGCEKAGQGHFSRALPLQPAGWVCTFARTAPGEHCTKHTNAVSISS